MTQLLELANTSTGYGSVKALNNVSLTVDHAEVVTLLGANGAGKTSLVRMIVGMLPIWEGSLKFADADIGGANAVKRARRGIIHVPQSRGIFPDLTVHENLVVALNAARKRSRDETLENVFGLFPKLSQLSKRSGGTLSGGEQQMLAIGRALMAEPRLIILDEPSLGLAPILVAQLYSAIRRLGSLGISVLVVEQAVMHALAIASRVYVMRLGQIVESGPRDKFGDASAFAGHYLA